MTLTARIIDSSTGGLVRTFSGEGLSQRKGLLLGGLGASGGGFGGGGISIGSSNFQETILGEAMVKAVKEIAEKLTKTFEKMSTGQ